MKHFVALTCGLIISTAAAQQVQVEFWHTYGDAKRGGWIQQKVEEFNKKNPGIKVLAQAKGNYESAFQAAILAARQGKPPALVQLSEAGSQLAIDSGIFQPISSIGKVNYGDYIKPVINYYTVQGKIYSLPFNSSSPVLYVNKTLAEKAGIKLGALPDTFGKINAACKKIKASGIEAKCITFQLDSWLMEQWVAEQGEVLVNNDNGRKGRATEANLTSEALKKAVRWMKSLNDDGMYTYTGKFEDAEGSQAIFVNQKAVFLIASTSRIGNITSDAKKNGFNVVVGQYPIPDQTTRNGVVISGGSLWVTQEIPDSVAEAAREFALFLTSSSNMVEWHKLTGYYPVRNSSVQSLKKEGWLEKGAPQAVAFNQLLRTKVNSATAGALFGSFYEVRKEIEQTLQRILQGAEIDPSLSDLKQKSDRIIKDYNSNF